MQIVDQLSLASGSWWDSFCRRLVLVICYRVIKKSLYLNSSARILQSMNAKGYCTTTFQNNHYMFSLDIPYILEEHRATVGMLKLWHIFADVMFNSNIWIFYIIPFWIFHHSSYIIFSHMKSKNAWLRLSILSHQEWKELTIVLFTKSKYFMTHYWFEYIHTVLLMSYIWIFNCNSLILS